MKITNKHNLPEAFVRAVAADSYSKGESDFSVTGLLKPPRATALEEIHKDDLEEDVADRMAALLGQATHKILELGARPFIDIIEKRYFAKFGDITVSGQIDLLETDTGTLSDYKTTKAWAFSKKAGSGKKPEWIQQMNMQLELIRMNGLDAKKLQIVGVLKDFDRKQADSNGYPVAEAVAVEVPIWSRKETQDFIIERINLHQQAKTELPQCSSSETWGGNRCRGYCSVAKFCTQYQKSPPF